jgi:xylulokinase
LKKNYLIGVDLGTSATKAALYRQDGTLIAEASREVPIFYPQPGVVEQENDDFYTTAAQSVQECLQKSGIDAREVAAIAFDSQMAGIGSIDEDFRPATRFDSWLDMRCQPYIEHMERQAGERIVQLTGCPPTCDHGPKILWWKHERPEEYSHIAKFVTPAGYVAGRTAGLKADQAFMDYTFIHFTGFSDSRAIAWSQELCQQFGLEMEKLPAIVEPWQVVGEVTEEAARDFGLAPGTPVAAGCGDTAANALGAGVVQPGMLFDSAGTAAVLAATTDRFTADLTQRALLNMHSVIPGLYHPLAYIAGGGIALRWFRDQFFNTRQGQPLPAGSDLYDLMIATAEQIPPGADGLFFSPHLGGRVCPSNPSMRGAWVGFSWGHTHAHFMRAVLESVAFEYAYYLNVLCAQLPDLKFLQARAVGGGARSRLWNQIKADVLQVPYQRLQRSEFGTWGSALVAGKAVGLYNDLASTALQTALPDGSPIEPNPSNRSIYAPLVDKYIRLEEMLNHYFNDSLDTSTHQ